MKGFSLWGTMNIGGPSRISSIGVDDPSFVKDFDIVNHMASSTQTGSFTPDKNPAFNSPGTPSYKRYVKLNGTVVFNGGPGGIQISVVRSTDGDTKRVPLEVVNVPKNATKTISYSSYKDRVYWQEKIGKKVWKGYFFTFEDEYKDHWDDVYLFLSDVLAPPYVPPTSATNVTSGEVNILTHIKPNAGSRWVQVEPLVVKLGAKGNSVVFKPLADIVVRKEIWWKHGSEGESKQSAEDISIQKDKEVTITNDFVSKYGYPGYALVILYQVNGARTKATTDETLITPEYDVDLAQKPQEEGGMSFDQQKEAALVTNPYGGQQEVPNVIPFNMNTQQRQGGTFFTPELQDTFRNTLKIITIVSAATLGIMMISWALPQTTRNLTDSAMPIAIARQRRMQVASHHQ